MASTELVLVFPALVGLLFAVVQFGLWYYDGSLARAAATEGVRAARLSGGSAADGQARAEAFLASAGRGGLDGVTVTASRDGQRARVEVRGSAPAIVPIPGLQLPVRGIAESPLEQLVPLTGRRVGP